MSVEYFEDVKVHGKYRSPGYLLEEQDIIQFATKWDPQLFHIDPEFAKTTKVGGLFASGAHLISICFRLVHDREPTRANVAGLGWEVKFLLPARPGDVLTYEEDVIWKRESKSDPNTGIIHSVGRLLNQRGETVFTIEGSGMVQKRPGMENSTS